MSIAGLARTIYNDRRNQAPDPPPPDSIARQIRITLRDQDTALPPGTDRITEILATAITRRGRPPAQPGSGPGRQAHGTVDPPAPVRGDLPGGAFPPNGYRLVDMAGNV